MPFLDQSFPAGLAMPSSLRVVEICSIPVPATAMPKMRFKTLEASGSGSSMGRFLAPSWTMTLL